MHAIPVRGPDGLIVSFVDPNAIEEAEEPITEEQTTKENERSDVPRQSRAIRPGERKPMGDLLGTPTEEKTQTSHSFTTGLAVGCVALLIAVALISLTRSPAQETPVLPTIAPSTVSTTPVPAIAVAAPTIGRAIVAYAAPDGAVMGAIAPDRAITVTGTFGSDWMQIEAAGSGRVWVHTVDVPSGLLDPAALAQLPNLAPPTATVAPTAVPVPASASVARPRTVPPASTDGCTPDRVVAVVRKGAQQVSSCISLADAQASLPGGTVVAANADEVRSFNDRVREQSTVLMQP